MRNKTGTQRVPRVNPFWPTQIAENVPPAATFPGQESVEIHWLQLTAKTGGLWASSLCTAYSIKTMLFPITQPVQSLKGGMLYWKCVLCRCRFYHDSFFRYILSHSNSNTAFPISFDLGVAWCALIAMLRSEELSIWNDLLHKKMFIIILKEPKLREVRLQAIGFMFVITELSAFTPVLWVVRLRH